MNSNPFLTETYKSIWLKHYQSGRKMASFGLIPDVSFLKHRFLPFYFNVGKTFTKGIVYSINKSESHSIKGQAILICDFPNRFNEKPVKFGGNLGFYRIPQYLGYFCSFDQIRDQNHYMTEVISASSRTKFRKYLKNLESDFTVEYKFYGRETSDDQLEKLFEVFLGLLHKRFADKKKSNNNIHPKEWAFHKEVSIALIKEEKAQLIVVEANQKPIAIVLVYMSDKMVIDVMRVFDITYARYRPGTICTIKQIDWCIQNGYSVLDFSKGHFEYKSRWSNNRYPFEYHIFYDRSSLIARFSAFSLSLYFRLKSFLRELSLDILWQKMRFYLRLN